MSNQSKKATATLIVDGMACGGCSSSVSKALKGIEGVTEVCADHEEGTASVTYNEQAVSHDDFIQTVDEAGYTVKKVN